MATTPGTLTNDNYIQPISGVGLQGIDFSRPLTFGPVNDASKLGKPGRKALSDIKGVTLGIQRYLPSIFNTIARVQTQQAPALTESQLKLLQQYGPGFANAEADMSAIGARRFAETQADILKNQAPGIAESNLELLKQSDPEFLKVRGALGEQSEKLLRSINPDGLTENEIANQERTQNRNNIFNGTANTGSPTAAIQSALSFDDRLSAKKNQLNSVLSSVGSFLPNFRSGIAERSAATATGSGGQNAGFENFASSTGQGLGVTSGLSNNMFSQGANLAANARNIEANKIPGWQQVMGALPDYS